MPSLSIAGPAIFVALRSFVLLHLKPPSLPGPVWSACESLGENRFYLTGLVLTMGMPCWQPTGTPIYNIYDPSWYNNTHQYICSARFPGGSGLRPQRSCDCASPSWSAGRAAPQRRAQRTAAASPKGGTGHSHTAAPSCPCVLRGQRQLCTAAPAPLSYIPIGASLACHYLQQVILQYRILLLNQHHYKKHCNYLFCYEQLLHVAWATCFNHQLKYFYLLIDH